MFQSEQRIARYIEPTNTKTGYISIQSHCSVLFGKQIISGVSSISWQSVLLVTETGIPRENHRPVASHWLTFFHIMLYRVQIAWSGFELTCLVMIGIYYTYSCKCYYHVITTTTSHIYWTCSQPEYTWNTVPWTSSNNQLINKSIL